MLDTLVRDVRLALRLLGRAPVFTAVVVATLGLGIGANAAIFNLLDQVLLRRLPVDRPDELVMLDGPGPFRGLTVSDRAFSYPMYAGLRDKTDVFSGVVARYATNVNLTYESATDEVNAELVSGNYFAVLGVGPGLGRTIAPEDDRQPGAHPVAVLSHGYWMRRFGGARAVVNRSITVNGHPYTVVGVAPPGFNGVGVGESPDLFVPLMMKAQMTPTWDQLFSAQARWLHLMARLSPGVTIPQAESSMNVLYRQLNEAELAQLEGGSERFRKAFAAKRLVIEPGARGFSPIRDQFSTPLVVLMGMVGLVLLIACANVANLLLARAVSRQREIAIRLALGASRRDLARQLVVESLVLASAGAAAGLLVATWAGEFLLRALPFDAAARSFSADPDARVVLFTLAVAVATGFLFGLVPALQVTRPSLVTTLKDESTSVVGSGVRLRKMLVVAQVALSVLLLVGAGLFARSLYNLRTLDPGFVTDQLLTFSVRPALNGYAPDRVRTLIDDLRRELSAAPGLRHVSVGWVPVLTDSNAQMTVRVDGYRSSEGEDMNPSVNRVTPGYFETFGQRLVDGRDFSDRDTDGAPKVAIINETMARRYFGHERAVGRRIGFGRSQTADIEVVGVVRDAKHVTLREQPTRFVYTPIAQGDPLESLTFYLRAQSDLSAASTVIRRVVRRVDPALPVLDLQTLETTIDESLFLDRLVAGLSASFGALATLLAAVGLYGVMSYVVASRRREIGIRLALGAEPARVMRRVLAEVALLATTGIAIGLPMALLLGRYVQSQLFGLSPLDPAVLAIAGATLTIVALAAGAIPALRAAHVDPLVALRAD